MTEADKELIEKFAQIQRDFGQANYYGQAKKSAELCNEQVKKALEVLKSIPNTVNGCELRIFKEDDNTWVVSYKSNYGCLKAKNDSHNECIHSNVDLIIAIRDALKWIENYI